MMARIVIGIVLFLMLVPRVAHLIKTGDFSLDYGAIRTFGICISALVILPLVEALTQRVKSVKNETGTTQHLG